MVCRPMGLLGPGSGCAGLLPLLEPCVPDIRHLQLPAVHVVRRTLRVHR